MFSQEQGDVPGVRDPAAAAGLRGQDRVGHRQRPQSHPPLQLRLHLQVGNWQIRVLIGIMIYRLIESIRVFQVWIKCMYKIEDFFLLGESVICIQFFLFLETKLVI